MSARSVSPSATVEKGPDGQCQLQTRPIGWLVRLLSVWYSLPISILLVPWCTSILLTEPLEAWARHQNICLTGIRQLHDKFDGGSRIAGHDLSRR